MFGKVFHAWVNPLTIKPSGRFEDRIGRHMIGELSCVRRAALPPMGKCDGKTVEIKIEGATTVPSYSPNRYTFEFPVSSTPGLPSAIESLEYEQCVVLGKNDNPKVTVTSNGIPVDVRGDIEIELKVFNCFDRSSTEEKVWMREITRKMKLHREDIAREKERAEERKKELEVQRQEGEKARRKIAEDLYMALEKSRTSAGIR